VARLGGSGASHYSLGYKEGERRDEGAPQSSQRKGLAEAPGGFMTTPIPVLIPGCYREGWDSANSKAPRLQRQVGTFERQRDLFPLPYFEEPVFDARLSISRCVRRRLLMKGHSLHRCNDAILALNELAGQGIKSHGTIPASSREAVDRVWKVFKAVDKPAADIPSSEGALRELLGTASIYAQGKVGGAPYSRDNISWPPTGTTPVRLGHCLLETDSIWLQEGGKRMLRSEADAREATLASGVRKPVCDSNLFKTPAVYGDFIKQFFRRGMLRFTITSSVGCNLGVFFVEKKDNSLRIIFDTRLLNCKFKVPPKTKLPSTAAYTALETHADSDLVLASADVSNASYGMAVPDAVGDLFTLPSIDARWLRDILEIAQQF
jgi:hypothetical protein